MEDCVCLAAVWKLLRKRKFLLREKNFLLRTLGRIRYYSVASLSLNNMTSVEEVVSLDFHGKMVVVVNSGHTILLIGD